MKDSINLGFIPEKSRKSRKEDFKSGRPFSIGLTIFHR